MDKKILKTYIKDSNAIDIYGNLKLDISYEQCIGKYFEFGDIVRVKFLDNDVLMPVVHSYKVGLISEPQLVFLTESSNPFGFIGIIYIDCTMSRFKLGSQSQNIEESGEWHFNSNVKFPIEVDITLEEKGGYKDTYELRTLKRSNKREDYPDLTDEEYANFRIIQTTGMGNSLFRGSSAIQERLNRNSYIDSFLKKYNIKNIINLTDNEESVDIHKGYEGSYYSKQNVLYLSMSVDMLSDRYKNGVRKAIQFIIDNEPPYYVHCVEGQDRTGFFCGMLEFFMGASFDEVIADYMKTYENYYGIKEGDIRYPFFAGDMIQVYERCFYTEPITNIDLKEASTNYFKELGFDDDALEKLKDRLR